MKSESNAEIERLKLIVDVVNGGFWDWNIITGEVYYSEAWIEGFGYTQETIEPTIQFWESTVHPEDMPEVQKKLKAHLDGTVERFEHEYRILRGDGKYAWNRDTAKIIEWDSKGKPSRAVGCNTDIDNLKKNEEKFQKDENKWHSIIDNSSDHIMLIGPEMIIQYINHTVPSLTKEEVIGQSVFNFVPKEIQNLTRRNLEKVFSTGENHNYESYYEFADGVLHYFDVRVSPIIENGEVNLIILSSHDITERKKQESIIANKTDLLSHTEKVTHLGSYILDITNGIWKGSDMLHEIFGIDKDYNTDINGWQEIIHPDDRDEMMGYFMNEVITKGNRFNKEYRIQKINNSEERWVHGLGELEFDESGNPIKMMGTIQDITERKKSQEKLKESEEKYRALYENAPLAYQSLDEDGCFLDVNPTWLKILGYKRTEIMGKCFKDLLHPDWVYNFEKNFPLFKKNGYIHNVQFKLCHKKGHYIDSLFEGCASYNSDGSFKQTYCVFQDITNRKQAEEKLKWSEQRLAAIMDQTTQGISVANPKGDYVMVNPAFCEMMGYTEDELLNMSVFDLKKNKGKEGKSSFKKSSSNEEGATVEVELMRKDESTFISEVIGKPIKIGDEDLILGIVNDLTERKTAEQELKKMNTAMEQSPATVVITNLDGNIEYVNPKFEETTGYQLKDVLGKNPRILKSGHTSDADYSGLWGTITSGKNWNGVFHNRRKDGSLFWEKASIGPIVDNNGEISHFVAVKEDITELKLAEQNLIRQNKKYARLNNELAIAKEKADESNRLKTAFLNNMSHEIRTPLNGIQGFLSLISNPTLTENEREEYIEIINKSSERLITTVTDIMDISKIESGQMKVHIEEVSINSLMDELQSFFSSQANSKGLDLFVVPTLSEDETIILTDNHKLHGILSNLIKNAIKFTKKGNVFFGFEINDDYLEFFVKDTGIGISEDKHQIVFNRFEQGNIGNTREYEGSGLGLSIAKAFVEMLGGRIWLTPHTNKGTEFKFTVPFKLRTEDSIEEIEIPSIPVTDHDLRKLTVLIADDEETNRSYLQIIFKNIFQELIFVETGRDAVNECKSNPDIDIILMDIKMPVMNGHDATRAIREFNSDVVIIAQTAYALSGDRERALESGCDEYVAKPVIKKEIIEIIKNTVKI